MRRIILAITAVVAFAFSVHVNAQFTPGQILSAAQLNSALSAKASNTAAAITGGTITGLSAPIPLASGGTGAATQSAALAALLGSSAVPIANGGTNATTATGATSQLQYLQGATGSVARSLTSRFQDAVSVKDFGAVCNGTSDDSLAIQAALNSGVSAVFVPQGTCVASNLTMPATVGFVLYGTGSGSILKQSASGNPLIKWNQSLIFYEQGYIRDLAFDGTNGTNNIVDTTGVGGETFQNLYFNNTPSGYSAIYVNGAASTYTHDIRLINIQVYSNVAGFAGVRFGPLTSDTSLDGFIMNGNFAVQYGIYADANAMTVRVSNSHPYNTATNIVKLAGGNNQWAFTNNVLDNANGDILSITSSSNITLSNNYIEEIKSGQYGANLVSTGGVTFTNTMFAGASGALAAVKDDAGSNTTIVVGGSIPSMGNFTAPFSLNGTNSYAIGLSGYNPLGLKTNYTGATTAAQAQNTTQYLGVNGAQASANNTAWVVPNNGTVTNAFLAVDSTPAAGQTFTFNVMSGATTLGTIIISNGSFSGTAAINASVTQYSQIYIKSVFSATSGSANVRYFIGVTQ